MTSPWYSKSSDWEPRIIFPFSPVPDQRHLYETGDIY